MNEEEKKITLDEPIPAPTLVFDGLGEESAAPVVQKQEEKPAAPVFDESTLTEAERKMVDDFASKIELSNSNMILQYGVGAQKKVADFSETALSNVRTKDLGEIGDMLSGVVTELKNFEIEEDEKGL